MSMIDFRSLFDVPTISTRRTFEDYCAVANVAPEFMREAQQFASGNLPSPLNPDKIPLYQAALQQFESAKSRIADVERREWEVRSIRTRFEAMKKQQLQLLSSMDRAQGNFSLALCAYCKRETPHLDELCIYVEGHEHVL